MQDLTVNPAVVDGRRATMNNRSPALTVPQVIAKAIDLKPGMFIRMTLQADGSLLFEREEAQVLGESRFVRVVTTPPHVGVWKLPVRPQLRAIIVHDEKKVVCNGESPAVTINKHVAQAIGMKNGSLVRFTLFEDGAFMVQLMLQTSSHYGVITVPERLDLGAFAQDRPVRIPAGRIIRKRDRVVPPAAASG